MFFLKLNRETIRLCKLFENIKNKNAEKIAFILKNQIEDFKSKMWIIEMLTIEVMTKKVSYWKEIFRETSIEFFEPNEKMTMIKLIESGFLNYRIIIEQTSKKAEKQYNIEKRLSEIYDKLKNSLQMDVKFYFKIIIINFLIFFKS